MSCLFLRPKKLKDRMKKGVTKYYFNEGYRWESGFDVMIKNNGGKTENKSNWLREHRKWIHKEINQSLSIKVNHLSGI